MPPSYPAQVMGANGDFSPSGFCKSRPSATDAQHMPKTMAVWIRLYGV